MIAHISPHSLCGSISAVGSKSFAHRALIASALFAQNPVQILGVTPSQDIFATANCLCALGAKVENFVVSPIEKASNNVLLNCVESGSTLRFLLPVVAALGVDASFCGSERLLQRPIRPLIEVLKSGGVTVDGWHIHGQLHSGDYVLPANISSQFVSGMLFALSALRGESRLFLQGEFVSKQYVKITQEVLAEFGVIVEETPFGFAVKGKTNKTPQVYCVEGDWSNATYFLVAGAVGGKVSLQGLNVQSCQGDRQILSVLQKANANLKVGKNIEVSQSQLKAFCIDAQQIPDAVPALAVLAAFSQGTSQISGVERLVQKESNRLQGVIEMLKTAGITAGYENSVLHIVGGNPHGGVFDAQNDHRMAMSQTILALGAQGDSCILGAQCVAKSYPEFFEDVNKLGGDCCVLEG